MRVKIAIISILAILLPLFISITSISQEQQPGQPLYFPKEDYEEHPSDLAPHTDPFWEQEKAKRERAGQPLDELYDDPPETYYEQTIEFKRVDEDKEQKPPSRWGN